MFEPFLFFYILFFCILASYFDLKTTEVPEILFYIFLSLGLPFLFAEYFFNINFLKLSLIVGSLFSVFGFVMYRLGQWGGADSIILSLIGFFAPSNPFKNFLFPFSLSLFVNIFAIGALYIILYALIYCLLNKKILFFAKKEFKKSFKIIVLLALLPLIFINKIPFPILLFPVSIFIVYKFAYVVENKGFRKRIRVEELKEGDVVEEFKVIRGASKEDIRRIKKSGKKFVVVKEGVRFAPVFPLSLIFTAFFGDFTILFFQNFLLI